MAKMLTRKTTAHQLFGSPADLPHNQLPTTGDVLRLILKHKAEDEEASAVKFANKNEAVKKAVADVTTFGRELLVTGQSVLLCLTRSSLPESREFMKVVWKSQGRSSKKRQAKSSKRK